MAVAYWNALYSNKCGYLSLLAALTIRGNSTEVNNDCKQMLVLLSFFQWRSQPYVKYASA